MAGNGGKLGRKQEEAIAALLTQRNLEEAARAAGIGTRTLIRWLKLPAFGKEYRKARRGSRSTVCCADAASHGRCGLGRPKAHDRPECSAAVKFRAPECVFDRAFKGIELDDIEARLFELERAAETSSVGHKR